jgi:hypothetical protein
MDYKLAKELEVAGFPQGGNGTWVYPLDALMTRPSDRIYAPTLEELIEACGIKFFSLEQATENNWHASYRITDKASNASGPTPNEAVARLWLALNKPNTTSEASS